MTINQMGHGFIWNWLSNFKFQISDFCFLSLWDIFRTFSQLISILTEATILDLANTLRILWYAISVCSFSFFQQYVTPTSNSHCLGGFQCLQVLFFFLIYKVFLIAPGQRVCFIKTNLLQLEIEVSPFLFQCFILFHGDHTFFFFFLYSENAKQIKQKVFLWFLR